MRDREIYTQWLSKSSDLRYLRQTRWAEIKSIMKSYSVNSVLEFGAGISTILFTNYPLSHLESYETDPKYIEFVKSISTSPLNITLWDNKEANIDGMFDLSFVDGALPRNTQLSYALKHSKIVAIDDYAGRLKHQLSAQTRELKRLDSQTTLIAIFKIN